MATVRMKDDRLVDSEGNEMEISYEELRDACIANLEVCNNPNVTYIVTFTIHEMTGYDCISNNIRRSSLFNRLENEILQNETYQAIKKKLVEKARSTREQYKERLSKTAEGEGYLKEIMAKQTFERVKASARGHLHYAGKGDTE